MTAFSAKKFQKVYDKFLEAEMNLRAYKSADDFSDEQMGELIALYLKGYRTKKLLKHFGYGYDDE